MVPCREEERRPGGQPHSSLDHKGTEQRGSRDKKEMKKDTIIEGGKEQSLTSLQVPTASQTQYREVFEAGGVKAEVMEKAVSFLSFCPMHRKSYPQLNLSPLSLFSF